MAPGPCVSASPVSQALCIVLYAAPHPGAPHATAAHAMPVATVAARVAARQAGDDDAEEGDDAVNDRGEHVADAADNGHDDAANRPEDGLELGGAVRCVADKSAGWLCLHMIRRRPL